MSTDVCGRLVEVMSGVPLDAFLRERVLDPLGMKETAFCAPESEVGRCSTLYTRGADRKLTPMAKPRSMTRPPTFLSGGGGLMSTTDDYLRFCHMLLNGGELDGVRLLGPRTVAYMGRNHLPGGKLLNELGQSTFAESAMEGTGFGLGFSTIEAPDRTSAGWGQRGYEQWNPG